MQHTGAQFVEQASQTPPKSVEEFLRFHSKGILDKIGGFFLKLGVHPNTVTILGLVGNFIGAGCLAFGHITIGGIVVLLCGPLDALDGAIARLRGDSSTFGAFVDSVTDRYSELIILCGLLVHFLLINDALSCAVVYLAAAGSVLVSYVKARAESLNYTAKVGILTRVERYLVLAPLLVVNQPVIAVWIIAILANFTALQRIWFVRKQAYDQISSQK
ncbi:CDP-alcohol phosphatidyltransferase family protein [Leptolinea tardivitalis]|uniref:CDP-alcohol phosphatidyltransferase family protein n=1 Tax=Leptolinea tardivitalis TaxID=229920 RepID=UPI00078127CA|nr:CDP-alcohol phosphatidyltransferase family protein [Leptolinea tardivitalis]GAP20060.1 phosphatidylglycerophosphate synthase [Leptolinea tardivitalis]